jgi:hypothetical protein
MTVAMLQAVPVGKLVNGLRKTCTNETAKSQAKKLLKNWLKLTGAAKSGACMEVFWGSMACPSEGRCECVVWSGLRLATLPGGLLGFPDVQSPARRPRLPLRPRPP